MINLKVNKIIKFLLISDLIFWAGWGLVSPIFSVFIVLYIQGGNSFVASMAAAIYYVLFAVLRVPMGLYLDGKRSQRADYAFTLTGFLIASVVSFGFIFATLPWHIYILQVAHTIGLTMNFAGFSGLFTRNLEKGRESTTQGIDGTLVSIGGAISAVIGGLLTEHYGYYGFQLVFILVGMLGLLGSVALLFIRNDLEKNTGRGLYFNIRDLMQRGEGQN